MSYLFPNLRIKKCVQPTYGIESLGNDVTVSRKHLIAASFHKGAMLVIQNHFLF